MSEIRDPDPRAACLEEILTLGREQLRCLERDDMDAFVRSLERQQSAIDRLRGSAEGRAGDPSQEAEELAGQITRIHRQVEDKLKAMMTDIADQRRLLAQNIEGVKAYTKKPIREDGSFIDTMG